MSGQGRPAVHGTSARKREKDNERAREKEDTTTDCTDRRQPQRLVKPCDVLFRECVCTCVRMCVCMCVCIACVSACACACDTMTCVWPSCGGREYVRRDGRCSTLIREQTYERAFKRISSARGLLERERERKNYPTSKHSRPDYRSNRSRIRSIRSPV